MQKYSSINQIGHIFITSSAGRMTKLGRTVGAERTVLRPYLGTRPAVIYHIFCLTFVDTARGWEKTRFSPSLLV